MQLGGDLSSSRPVGRVLLLALLLFLVDVLHCPLLRLLLLSSVASPCFLFFFAFEPACNWPKSAGGCGWRAETREFHQARRTMASRLQQKQAPVTHPLNEIEHAGLLSFKAR